MLHQAIEHFSAIDPVTARHGASTSVKLAFRQTGCRPLRAGLTGRDSRAAERAVPLLRHAVDHFGPDYARPRALYLPDLAGAHAIAGDTDTAVTVGYQSVDAVTAVQSLRAYDRLRVLNTALEPLHASAGVAELRGRLAAPAA